MARAAALQRLRARRAVRAMSGCRPRQTCGAGRARRRGTRAWLAPARLPRVVPSAQRIAQPQLMTTSQSLLIGLVSISDRASKGVYEDKGIPGLEEWFSAALKTPWRMETRLIPDEQPIIERTLIELVDRVACDLVLTTGGTGPARRDVTPEATLAVAHKVLPGFGEQMRQVSRKYVPTAILSRQLGVVRGRALILNLPGQPKAIKETLDGVFPAVPYCLDLIGGPYVETREEVCKAFRPKSARAPVS